MCKSIQIMIFSVLFAGMYSQSLNGVEMIYRGPRGGSLAFMGVNPVTKQIIMEGNDDKFASIYEFDGFRLVESFPFQEVIRFIQFSPDGKKISGFTDSSIYIYDLEKKVTLNKITLSYDGYVQTALVRQNDKYISCRTKDRIVIYDAWTLQKKADIAFPYSFQEQLHVSPDLSFVFALDHSKKKIVRLNLLTGKVEFEKVFENIYGFYSSEISPDGKSLYVVNGGVIFQIDTENGNIVHRISVESGSYITTDYPASSVHRTEFVINGDLLYFTQKTGNKVVYNSLDLITLKKKKYASADIKYAEYYFKHIPEHNCFFLLKNDEFVILDIKSGKTYPIVVGIPYTRQITAVKDGVFFENSERILFLVQNAARVTIYNQKDGWKMFYGPKEGYGRSGTDFGLIKVPNVDKVIKKMEYPAWFEKNPYFLWVNTQFSADNKHVVLQNSNPPGIAVYKCGETKSIFSYRFSDACKYDSGEWKSTEDGRYMYRLSLDGYLFVIDLVNMKVIHDEKIYNVGLNMIIDPVTLKGYFTGKVKDSTMAADFRCGIYDVAKKSMISEIPGGYNFGHFLYLLDGGRILCGSAENVKIISAKDFSIIKTYSFPFKMSMMADGWELSEDKTVLYTIDQKSQMIYGISVETGSVVLMLVFFDNGEYIMLTGDGKVIKSAGAPKIPFFKIKKNGIEYSISDYQ